MGLPAQTQTHPLMASDAAMNSSGDTASPLCISDLPVDVASMLLLRYLTPHEIVAVMASCVKLKLAAEDEQQIWRVLCEEHFGMHTIVDDWISERGIRLYRHLYPVLATFSSYVGVWQKAATSSPRGALFSFRWGPNGIEVVQLVPSRAFLTNITHKKLCTLGPDHPRYQAEVLDGNKCVLRDYGSSGAGTYCSAAAAAAACVAAGGAGRELADAAGVGGSSPQGSAGFAYELLRFMQSSVQKTRSGRRNRRSGGSECNPPVLHHFCRVLCPLRQPSRQHPHQLAGLWKGLYGPHGCELLRVSYDFSGSSAAIVATKLTGDANVPAGEVTWRAAAAPLSLPWPEAEQQLLQLRPSLVAAAAATAAQMADSEAADEAAGNIIAALIQQEEPPEQAMQLLQQDAQQQQQQGQDAGQQGLLTDQQQSQPAAAAVAAGVSELQLQQQADASSIAAWAASLQARRVVNVYKGQGRVAGHGFKDPRWVDGRLWVYDDGSCGFVFMLGNEQHAFHHLVDLERMDGDL